MIPSYLLSWMIFVPLGGAAVIACLPARRHEVIRTVAACTSALPLVMGVILLLRFRADAVTFQFVEHYTWIPAFGIEYFVGVDGISLPLLALTVLLVFLALVTSWRVGQAVKGYFALILVLETGLIGAFGALDACLLWVFWEVVLVTVFFLVAFWGQPGRETAATRFLITTQVGAMLLLIAILALRQHVSDPVTGRPTFNLILLMDQANHDQWLSVVATRHLLWCGIALGCAALLPVVPLHVWLPSLHTHAQPSISLLVAGVVVKLGAYGLLRIALPVLPDATAWGAPVLVWLGVVGVLWGGFCALAAGELSRVVAFGSLSILSFVPLGLGSLTSEGLHGAAALLVGHGLVLGMLFVAVGGLRDRAGHLDLPRWGGLYRRAPVLAAFFTAALLAVVGLPGLAVFPGVVLVLLGAFARAPLTAVLAAGGLVLGASWVVRVVLQVCLREPVVDLGDNPAITAPELGVMVPLGALVLALGLYPQPLLVMGRTVLDALLAAIGG